MYGFYTIGRYPAPISRQLLPAVRLHKDNIGLLDSPKPLVLARWTTARFGGSSSDPALDDSRCYALKGLLIYSVFESQGVCHDRLYLFLNLALRHKRLVE